MELELQKEYPATVKMLDLVQGDIERQAAETCLGLGERVAPVEEWGPEFWGFSGCLRPLLLVATALPLEHGWPCDLSLSELQHSFPFTYTAAGSCIVSFLEVFDFFFHIFHFYLL